MIDLSPSMILKALPFLRNPRLCITSTDAGPELAEQVPEAWWKLDTCAANYSDFPMLDNAYIFPADVRLTLYGDSTRWALVLEALGFSPKAGEDADEWLSHTETFRQLTAVLCTGDPTHHKPTEPPNTHWRHWPHGGDGVTAPTFWD